MRLLRQAQTALRAAIAEIDQKKTKLENALIALGGSSQGPAPVRSRRKMTKAQREAIGLRMRKYWRQRRAAEKGKG